jgi:hypothetical protein
MISRNGLAVKEEGLRRFRVLKNGIPSQDTFFRVFGALNPQPFEAVFRRWGGAVWFPR